MDCRISTETMRGLDKVRSLCYVKNVPSNQTRTGEVEELAQGTGSGKSAVKSSGRGTGKGEVTWGVFIWFDQYQLIQAAIHQ